MIHRIVSLGISGIVHELRYRLKRRRPSHPPSLEPGATPLVSVLCATNRPEQLAHLLATFDTQTWTNRELIVVTNADGFDLSAIAERQDVLVCPTPTETSLGACLNIGRQVATGQILARIDDDDSYSASYLDGVVKTFQQVDAAIVGKQEYFAYVVSTDQTYRRFPGRANRYVGRVAGGNDRRTPKPHSRNRLPRQDRRRRHRVRSPVRARWIAHLGRRPGRLCAASPWAGLAHVGHSRPGVHQQRRRIRHRSARLLVEFHSPR